MRKIITLLLSLIFVLTLVSCNQTKYPELPQDAIAFDMVQYINKDDDEASYATIEYEGRTYIPYGTIGKTFHETDIDSCIGYLVQDGEKDIERRIYTLIDDIERNYLMDYYVGDSFMNQPCFWRAIDTKGKEITTPNYIRPVR